MKFILKSVYLDVLKALSFVIDVEEKRKLYHSWRVAAIAQNIAKVKCPDYELPIYIAGLVHDVGTFDLKSRLVHHADQMENVKIPDVRIHPQKGAAIVATLPGFIPISKMILDHHEWINGQGYPRGLKNGQISLYSQILRISDKCAFIFDEGRVKKPQGMIKILKERIGKEFTKELYEIVVDIFEENYLLWSALVNEEKLTLYTQEVFNVMHVETDFTTSVYKTLVQFFGRILDAKHSYTEGHSQRVSYFSILIALAMNLPDEEIRKIELAAYLHDIGKLGIPKKILDKPGPLSKEERETINSHASLSHDIVQGIKAFENIANIVGADQEHWDGSGYPEGLSGDEIPLGAKIIFIADAFDAMTSNRSYHQAISVVEAIKEIRRCAGTDFDPEIAEIACELFEGFQNSSMVSCYYEVGQKKQSMWSNLKNKFGK